MEVTSPGRIPVQPTFDTGNVDDEKAIELKEEFTTSISRGGLCKPSDDIFISSAHAFSLLRYVIHDDRHKKTLLSTQNPKNAFIEVFLRVLAKDDNTNSVLSMKCKSGHSQEKGIRRVAFTAFNICCKNIVSEIRDEAHAMKKRPGSAKNSKPERKIKKLQSN